MSKRSIQDLILIVVVGLGALLRIRQFLFARSIWLDEATFANGILESPLIDLLTQKHQFIDPVGVIVFNKLGASVFGRTEFVFRWIPLAAGIGAVVLAALLARRVFATGVARIAFTGLVALSPVLIYYSNEAQQYSLDVLAAIAIVWVFASFEQWRRGFIVLVLTGVLFPWFSYASIIVLFGVGVALAVRWLLDRSYGRIGIVGASWGLSALIVLIHARIVTRTDSLEEYWTSTFAPFPITSTSDLLWYPRSAGGIVETAWFAEGFVQKDPLMPSLVSWLILALIVVGAILLVRRRPWLALAMGVMGASALVVSALGLYPLGSRPGLYMVPLAFLLAVEPIDWAMKRSSLGWRLPAGLVAAALLLTVAVPSVRLFVEPDNPSDMKGALSFFIENREPGDGLVVHGWSSQAFRFYEPLFELEDQYSRGTPREFDVATFLAEFGSDPNLDRAWLVFSHRVREAERFVDELAEVAPLLQRSDDPSFLVALFDLSSPG